MIRASVFINLKEIALKEGSEIKHLVYLIYPIKSFPFKTNLCKRFGFDNKLEFQDIPIFEDRDCNKHTAWIIDTLTNKIYMRKF